MEASTSEKAFAFLVDGDNASAKLLPEMLAEASKFGKLTIRKVYGDWTSSRMKSWKKALQEHALAPMQQFANIEGKNATDSAMIIDAMDILHSELVRGFVIVSSDSDYTRLATRIREAGLFVVGIGRSNTPSSFRQACHVFVATENLGPAKPRRKRTAAEALDDAMKTLEQAFDNVVGDDGLANLAKMGLAVRRLDSAFDPRTYGYPKLLNMIEAIPDAYEIERKEELGTGAVYVKRKQS